MENQSRPFPPKDEMPYSFIRSYGAFFLMAAFLSLAAVFWFGSEAIAVPGAPTPQVNKAAIRRVPLRTPMQDPPTTLVGGFNQRCNACHALFETTWDGKTPLQQHTNIVLEHGNNDNCLNCHARQDREKLSNYNGEMIDFAQVQQLCAGCHGPIARDWARGTHGKTMGSWDPKNPEFHRIVCTACHDPHHPSYWPLEPMPGPNTLRMGEPRHPAREHESNRDPLSHWRHVETEQHGDEGGH